MNAKQFRTKLNQLKKAAPRSDYRLELYYQGVNLGCIYNYPESDLDEIEVEDCDTYVLIYTNTIGVFVDKAELRSI